MLTTACGGEFWHRFPVSPDSVHPLRIVARGDWDHFALHAQGVGHEGVRSLVRRLLIGRTPGCVFLCPDPNQAEHRSGLVEDRPLSGQARYVYGDLTYVCSLFLRL